MHAKPHALQLLVRCKISIIGDRYIIIAITTAVNSNLEASMATYYKHTSKTIEQVHKVQHSTVPLQQLRG
jgi:hypothetical protein